MIYGGCTALIKNNKTGKFPGLVVFQWLAATAATATIFIAAFAATVV
jgi:hypothetical protein